MVSRSDTADTLQQLLHSMDVISRKLEEVVVCEQEAVHRFDADALVQLVEIRSNCHQQLTALEARCRDLMRQADMPEDLGLEAFIDLHLTDVAPQLQAIRRKLYQRMAKLAETNEDQRIRLRAAYEVTSNVLHQIGILETKGTYGPGGAL